VFPDDFQLAHICFGYAKCKHEFQLIDVEIERPDVKNLLLEGDEEEYGGR
jgi:hypothetical protein